MIQQKNLEAAIDRWRKVLGAARVLTQPSTIKRYCRNTAGAERRVSAVLQPESLTEIEALVRVAGEYKLPLYPISTGHNWGYGSASPVTDDAVIVDLSRLSGIDDSEIELGLITVEPGVTQGILRDFLDQHGHPFLVPVHGGGPNCSLVGNALERGYGIPASPDDTTAGARLCRHGRPGLPPTRDRTADHADQPVRTLL
ncbi:FAD-binding oxidoreductase [Halochromatium glycolicum]|uniref:FAD-binding oxidoreductase n=1 Tax=Halochromatium glycolicum TaxID=85075 RepID=UPI00190C3533